MHLIKVLLRTGLFFLVMLVVFFLTFNGIGGKLSHLLTQILSHGTYVLEAFLTTLHVSGWFHSLLIDGVCTGVTSVLTFVPTIMVLFFLLTVLEESGYLERVAVLLDGPFRTIGLSGASAIPMIMGFGCSVPAILAAGAIPNAKVRFLTMVLIPFMSCSAKLPIYGMLANVFFPHHAMPVIFAVYLLGILLAVLLGNILSRLNCLNRSNSLRRANNAAGLNIVQVSENAAPHTPSKAAHQTASHATPQINHKNRLYTVETNAKGVVVRNSVDRNTVAVGTIVGGTSAKEAVVKTTVGRAAVYIPSKTPSLRKCYIAAITAGLGFVKKAFTVILIASIIVWLLENFDTSLQMTDNGEDSILAHLGTMAVPFFTPLGFGDWRAASALIAGLSAKETVISTFAVLSDSSDLSAILTDIFTPTSAISFMAFCLLYVPCISTLAVIKKETGSVKYSFLVLLSQTAIAWLVSFLIYHSGMIANMII